MNLTKTQVYRLLAEFEEIDDRVGGFEDSIDAYKSGYAVRISFVNPVADINNSIAHAKSLLNGHIILYQALQDLSELLEDGQDGSDEEA